MNNLIEDEKIIREYTNKYENKVKKFLMEVAIDEFGFKEWKPYFEKSEFLKVNKERENFWMAIDANDDVIGTIGILDDDNASVAKLHSLYVRKEYRKLGIATKLYRCAEEFAKKIGYRTIILHTYKEFDVAIKFYNKKGFKFDESINSKDGFWYSKNLKRNFTWNDYFSNIRNKYSMRLSTKRPMVINLDGKGITNNPHFSLIDNTSIDGFLDIMEKTVKYFTIKYNCISIFGTDEVSFVFEKPQELINDINSDLNTKSDEIISMFSQLFFDHFNSLNKKEKVFWHGECFSIPNGKINSYIKYKSGSIKNVLTTYFLKKNNIKNAGRIKLSRKIEICENNDFYKAVLKEIENGILYYNGNRIDIQKFLNGNIEIVDAQVKEENKNYFDITKLDW